MSIKHSQVMNNRKANISKSRGFSLFEALIGFMVLSIGMLGIASLQAISLKSGKTSVYGSVAMMKVDELFESMRANPSALAAYTGGGADNGCTGTKDCDPAQLAADDVFWWKNNLKAGLPSAATTVVTVTAAAPPSKMAVVKIDVSWKERDKDAASSINRTYSTTANICTAVPC